MSTSGWFKRMVSIYGHTVAAGSIATAELANLAVDATKLASNAVTAAKILDGEISAAKMGADSIATASIQDSAVTADKLAANAVTTNKIADASITSAKLAEAMGTAAIADGAVTNVKIASGANIDVSKLALLDGKVLIGDATNKAAAQTLAGDVTVSAAGATSITANSIINADINTAAAIALSKLAALADGNLIIGSAASVATSVAMSGDATITNGGVITIGATAVGVSKLSAALQEAIPLVAVSGIDNTNGTGTFTVQVKDAAGADLAEYMRLNVWRAGAAYGAPAAATGFVAASGTLKLTLTAHADLDVITTSNGVATFTVTDDGEHHVMAEVDGRIYTGTVTVTTV